MSQLSAVCVVLALASAVHADRKPAARKPPARASTPLSLPDVLQVAVRQSPAMARAVVEIDTARSSALSARGLDDLTVTARAGVWRTQAFQLQLVPGVFERDAIGAVLGLTRGLASGGTINLQFGGQRLAETFKADDGTTTNGSATRVVADVSATLTHPLIRGAGTSIARADRGRAKGATAVATLEQQAEALALVRDVIVAYWQLAYARRVVEIRAEGLRLATEQLRITQTAVRTGAAAPTEILAAEQAVALREQAHLTAQVAVSQQSLDLRRRVGLEIGRDQIDVDPTTPLDPPGSTFDVDATIARALERSPYLRAIAARGGVADIDVEVTADTLRPRLDIRASAGTLGFADRAGSSIAELGKAENPQWSVVLEYEQQLGARTARGANERAKAARRRVKIDLEEARRELTVSVAHAIDLLRIAQKRIEVGDRAVQLAKRTLEVQQTRFKTGQGTNFEVSLRTDELQQASVDRALAIADALAAEAALHALTGDLLERHRIRID